ncbi:class I SAM-dependent methyltransferase [Longimicrobium terrae]|nr:class I SAM-dependent methyltransferase [Longimicrobium terrae]
MRAIYNSMRNARAFADAWHRHTHAQTELFVRRTVSVLGLPDNATILNAGSGGNDLGLQSVRHIQTDIAESTLYGVPSAVTADLQALPFADAAFDLVVSVGCVLNYCDVASAAGEVSRVLRPGGYAILDFERSRTFEFIWTEHFDRNATLIHTFYNGVRHPLWVYSDQYVASILLANDLVLCRRMAFHLLSPLLLRVTRSQRVAAFCRALDRPARYLPGLPAMACNTIWLCKKRHDGDKVI